MATQKLSSPSLIPLGRLALGVLHLCVVDINSIATWEEGDGDKEIFEEPINRGGVEGHCVRYAHRSKDNTWSR